jgi:hypothetical protein
VITAFCFGSYNTCLCRTGGWKEAETLEVVVMEKRKQVLGDDHPDTLTSMENLASTYWNQGRWKEAEMLEMMVIEKTKQVLKILDDRMLVL